MRFDFPGKHGVRQYRELGDRQVARVLRELLKCRKSEVFKYQSDDGQFIDSKRRDINDYIKEVMGRSFSAKGFRTWALERLFALASLHVREPKNLHVREPKNLKAARLERGR